MKNRIEVHIINDHYVARFIGPHAEHVRDLFGSCFVPLPWALGTAPARIVADLRRRNPDVAVAYIGR